MAGRIFLCYAKEDKARIEEIYITLREAGLEPWMDKPPKPYQLDGIKPGQFWANAITENISRCSFFLAFLSKTSVSKKGYVQREYRLALENMAKMPEGQLFLVPVLLESNCLLPKIVVDTIKFDDLQWFDCESDGLDTLIRFLKEEISGSKIAEVIHVSAVPELLTSIGSDRVLELDASTYLLGPEAIEGDLSEHIYMERVFDGWQLNIRDVNNLAIEGAARDKTQLFVTPQYSFVLSLQNCRNIKIRNLTLAHSPPGRCTGGVVKLEHCKQVMLDGCNLYGSGTVGLELRQVDDLAVMDTEVAHCTYGIMTARGLSNAKFTNVDFRENGEFFGIKITRSKEIEFVDCGIIKNIANEDPLLAISPDTQVIWKGGKITHNRAKSLHQFPRSVSFERTDIVENDFEF